MEGNFAKELYGESLQLSKSGVDGHEFENNDGSIWANSDEESNRAYDLDREWQRRRKQFHTIGYREGIIAGKEAAAQEGFNAGFKQSVLAGYNLGLVRGASSALACLPNGLREKLIEEEETRNKFRKLHESLYCVSTQDAVKSFHDTTMTKQHEEQMDDTERTSESCKNDLENYSLELRRLLNDSPAMKVKLSAD